MSLEAAWAADRADSKRILERRFPEWFPALAPARQEALAWMHSEIGAPDMADWTRVLEHVGKGEFHMASATMLLSEWCTRAGQRAWRIAQVMRTGEAPTADLTAH